MVKLHTCHLSLREKTDEVSSLVYLGAGTRSVQLRQEPSSFGATAAVSLGVSGGKYLARTVLSGENGYVQEYDGGNLFFIWLGSA